MVGLDKFVHLDVSGTVGFSLEGNFNLSGCQGKCTFIVPPFLQLFGNGIQISDSFGDGSLIIGIHQLLSLHIGEGSSGPDDGFAVLSFDNIGFSIDFPDG